jgi:hypothetical protein
MSDETNAEKPKRERAKDESPMARAKVATTQLRIFQGIEARKLQAIDRTKAELSEVSAKREAFVAALAPDVVKILEAGGVL